MSLLLRDVHKTAIDALIDDAPFECAVKITVHVIRHVGWTGRVEEMAALGLECVEFPAKHYLADITIIEWDLSILHAW
jgi:hypothetical protein